MKQDFVDHHLIFDTAVRRIGDDLDGTPTLRTGFYRAAFGSMSPKAPTFGEHPFQASPQGAYFWWAQAMALRFSSGVLFSSCRLFPRRAVVIRVLCLLFGWCGIPTNTPWNRVRLTRGFGTSEASFAMKSNDSNITCVVPSL